MSPRKLCLSETELKEWRALCMQALAAVGNLQDGAPDDPDVMRLISENMHRLTLRESMRWATTSLRMVGLQEEDEA